MRGNFVGNTELTQKQLQGHNGGYEKQPPPPFLQVLAFSLTALHKQIWTAGLFQTSAKRKEEKKRGRNFTPSSLFLQVALKCIWCTLVAALVILNVMNAKGETVITDAVFEIIHVKTNEHMNLFQFIQFDFSWTHPLEKFRSRPSQSICLPYENHREFWLHEVLISSALMFSLMVRQLLNFTQRHISFSSGNLSTFICCVTLHNPHIHACLPSIHVTQLIISNYLWRLFTIHLITVKSTKSAMYYYLLLYYDDFFLVCDLKGIKWHGFLYSGAQGTNDKSITLCSISTWGIGLTGKT